jgi:hypothetical protein
MILCPFRVLMQRIDTVYIDNDTKGSLHKIRNILSAVINVCFYPVEAERLEALGSLPNIAVI